MRSHFVSLVALCELGELPKLVKKVLPFLNILGIMVKTFELGKKSQTKKLNTHMNKFGTTNSLIVPKIWHAFFGANNNNN